MVQEEDFSVFVKGIEAEIRHIQRLNAHTQRIINQDMRSFKKPNSGHQNLVKPIKKEDTEVRAFFVYMLFPTTKALFATNVIKTNDKIPESVSISSRLDQDVPGSPLNHELCMSDILLNAF